MQCPIVTRIRDLTRTKSQIVPVIVEKCLASTRAGTRSKSLDILLKIVEIDGADYVMVSWIDYYFEGQFNDLGSIVGVS